jgi:hypothetical protein
MILRILILSLMLLLACQNAKNSESNADSGKESQNNQDEGFFKSTVINPLKNAKDAGSKMKERNDKMVEDLDNTLNINPNDTNDQ